MYISSEVRGVSGDWVGRTDPNKWFSTTSLSASALSSLSSLLSCTFHNFEFENTPKEILKMIRKMTPMKKKIVPGPKVKKNLSLTNKLKTRPGHAFAHFLVPTQLAQYSAVEESS